MPPSWFAQHMDVILRTVVRWFDSKEIPAAAELAVNELVAKADFLVEDMSKPRRVDDIVLYTYRIDADCRTDPPVAGWHRAVTYRAANKLSEAGYRVTIEYHSAD